MNRYVVVNPRKRTVETVNCATIYDAQIHAGIVGGVDHGMIARSIGYCVAEFGLFVPPAQQSYFGLAGTLFAGSAVFYRFDEAGETLDLYKAQFPDVRFFLGINDVEAAIHHGEIERPFMAVNGVQFWEWPQPAPEGMKGDVGG